MTGLTAAVAMLFVGIVVVVRPSFALGVIILSMLIYPEFMRIQMGPAAMSVPRLAAIALLVKLFAMGHHKKTEFHKVDKLVIALWIWLVVAALISGGVYTERIGRIFDTVFMYLIARYSIFSIDDIKSFFLPLAITAVVMGILGAIESSTTFSIYRRFEAWTGNIKGDEFRYGFLRAKASTAVHIYFGMAMVIITGIAWSIRGYVKPTAIHYFVLPVAFTGALSSMSSGPWLAAIFLLVFNAYLARVSLIKPSLWMLLLIAIVFEIGSNRHFYYLIQYIALSEVTAYYRAKLMEVFFINWSDWWFVGTGTSDLWEWAQQVDGRHHLDIVNNFVLLGTYGGLLALILYIGSHVVAIRRLMDAWRGSTDKNYRKLIFGLGATLITIDAASLSASVFGPVLLLSYILLGMMINVSMFNGALLGHGKKSAKFVTYGSSQTHSHDGTNKGYAVKPKPG